MSIVICSLTPPLLNNSVVFAAFEVKIIGSRGTLRFWYSASRLLVDGVKWLDLRPKLLSE